MSIETYGMLIGKMELYRLLDEGIRSGDNDEARPAKAVLLISGRKCIGNALRAVYNNGTGRPDLHLKHTKSSCCCKVST